MAVNTVLKIAESCKEEFVMVHAKQNEIQNQAENVPYIDELIRRIPDETNMLEPEHKIVFYEAIGHMISAEPNFDRKQYLLQGVLQDYWTVWDTMLREIEMNFESLRVRINFYTASKLFLGWKEHWELPFHHQSSRKTSLFRRSRLLQSFRYDLLHSSS